MAPSSTTTGVNRGPPDDLTTAKRHKGHKTDSRPGSTTAFQYHGLESHHIRLVRITSAPGTAQLKCELEHFVLDHQLAFQALSYEWGHEPASCNIVLNEQTVPIRKNLWRFLKQAQDVDLLSGQWIWIDAMCINQADAEERTHQVQYMRSIFSSAHKVIAWLGPAHHDSDVVFDYLASSNSTWKRRRVFKRIWQRHQGGAVMRLCQRTYFGRLWIFQELVLAKDLIILCGEKRMAWKHLQAFLTCVDTLKTARLYDNVDFRHTYDRPALVLVRLINDYEQEHRLSLWQLLMRTSEMRCADPRDKVFALLGVAEGGDTGIEADYTKQMSLVLNEVLKHQHSLCKPQSLDEVTDQCRKLEALISPYLALTTDTPATYDIFHIPRAIPSIDTPVAFAGSKISLWWSMEYGHDTVFDFLASLDIVHVLGLAKALDCAILGRDTVAISWLLHPILVTRYSSDSMYNALKIAVSCERLPEAETIWEASRLAIDGQRTMSSEFFRWAVEENDSHILQFLLDQDSVRDILNDLDHGCGIMRCAIEHRSLSSVQILLKSAKVDLSALHHAPFATSDGLSIVAKAWLQLLKHLANAPQTLRFKPHESVRELRKKSTQPLELACCILVDSFHSHFFDKQRVLRPGCFNESSIRLWTSHEIVNALAATLDDDSLIHIDIRVMLAFLSQILGRTDTASRLVASSCHHIIHSREDDVAHARMIARHMIEYHGFILKVFVRADMSIMSDDDSRTLLSMMSGLIVALGLIEGQDE